MQCHIILCFCLALGQHVYEFRNGTPSVDVPFSVTLRDGWKLGSGTNKAEPLEPSRKGEPTFWHGSRLKVTIGTVSDKEKQVISAIPSTFEQYRARFPQRAKRFSRNGYAYYLFVIQHHHPIGERPIEGHIAVINGSDLATVAFFAHSYRDLADVEIVARSLRFHAIK